MKIETIGIEALVPYQNNARLHSDLQIEQIARSIGNFGFNNPVLIDKNNSIIAGHGRVLAAKQLGLQNIPCIRHEHLSPVELKAYIIADNKLAEKSTWDHDLLKLEFEDILQIDTDFDLTATGFDTPQIDIILTAEATVDAETIEDFSSPNISIIKRVSTGDVWQLGSHKLFCGDSLDIKSFETLLDDEIADVIFCDPPYNVPINGHVMGKGGIEHDEFSFASGEMTSTQFIEFLESSFNNLKTFSKDGSIHFVCMDWRHVQDITAAADGIYTELKNICVWNKQSGGMGSLYRSQHEMIFVFKNGEAPHTNNIELGKHGRYRTNIWDYSGVHISSPHRNDLKYHPTVKPISMISDAIIDCSKQGDLVLDCFAGSGSTLLAAERTKRKARVIEFEPKYCDVILHRFEQMTGIMPQKIEVQDV